MRKDSEMIWFPLLAGFFSLLYGAALLVPTTMLTFASDGADRYGQPNLFGPIQILVLFVMYFGLSFIATFFNVCVVYTTRVRLSGGDATFMDSIKFALSRVHLIAAWSAVSATVGLVLHAIDSMAQRAGLAGKILLWILRTVLAAAWAIMTVFVVPAMVYRDLGPIDAIKDSLDTLKRTWGESLVRYYGVGLASFICALPFIGLFFGGFFVAQSSGIAAVAMMVLGAIGFMAVSLVFGVLGTVWKTVLYHFATTGQTPEGYSPELLRSAFVQKQGF
jgi:hypothetical protein